MEKSKFWADAYVEKRCSATAAIDRICSGQRVFVASACGAPGHLVRELVQASPRLHALEIMRLESADDDLLLPVTRDPRHITRIVSLESSLNGVRPDSRFLTPMNVSALPRLLKTRNLPIDVALVQACPPDDFGWMSLGVSVDVVLAACQTAERVIVQVNPQMPRTLGRGFIHVNDVDDIVEYDEAITTVSWPSPSTTAVTIARHVQRLVDDESTLQISPGPLSEAILRGLSGKRQLGIHTGYLTDAMMHLVSAGAITNRKKGFNEGKLTACGAIGSRHLYEFLDDNPAVEFHPADYIHHPDVISRHHRMVAINAAVVMDLTGQVAALPAAGNRFGGITAMPDFIRGAAQARQGKAIIVLEATGPTGKRRIVSQLDTPVVLQRGDVHDVVTEYGAVNLFGKSLQERALAMISIAHPDVRESLFDEAKALGLLGSERALKASIRGVYPLELEETVVIDGEAVTIRPAKPVDERRIQEHFYNLPADDVISRFFQKRTRFLREELEPMSQIDYIKDLTLVAVVGEFGFGKVVAMGGYLLEIGDNMAEVAFSVDRNWQGKGLGKRIGAKLAAAARENGIAGLTAYTLSHNRSMVRLFNSLPFKVKTRMEYDTLLLSCRFDEMRSPD
jgi:acyl-CoA hydrolase/GNAT superfamily N-acetyltransferase